MMPVLLILVRGDRFPPDMTVEQNAKKGLEFADIGYVLVSGEIAIAGTGAELLDNPEAGRLFLGG